MKKKILLIIAVFALAIYGIPLVIQYSFNEGFISKKTENKYYENINKYEMINNNEFDIDIKFQDTLSFIAKMPWTLPFVCKWYINDVGIISIRSKLSKKLDSLSDNHNDSLKINKQRLK